jgi:hypothetical protein
MSQQIFIPGSSGTVCANLLNIFVDTRNSTNHPIFATAHFLII